MNTDFYMYRKKSVQAKKSIGPSGIKKIIIITLIAVIAMFFLILRPVMMKISFDNFKSDIVKSVLYARQNDSYSASFNKSSLKIDIEKISKTVAYVCSFGMGEKVEMPDEDVDTYVISFGDGSSVKFKHARVKVFYRFYQGEVSSLYVKYVNTEGKEYSYVTSKLKLQDIERLLKY